jgi:hypothetical protein
MTPAKLFDLRLLLRQIVAQSHLIRRSATAGVHDDVARHIESMANGALDLLSNEDKEKEIG